MEELIEKLVDEIGLAGDNGVAASRLGPIVRTYYEEKNKSTESAQNQPRNEDSNSTGIAQDEPTVVDEPLLLSIIDQLAQHEHIEVKPDESQPENASPLQSTLYASEEQVWKSITGHGIDTARIPIRQWELLLVIAAAGRAGITQPTATRQTDQDKRSVPLRTDRLTENGYITKEPVSASGQKTSFLRLKRFAGEQVTQGTDPMIIGSKKPMIFYSSWFDETMRMLRENGGIKTMDDLRTGIGIHAMSRETKIYLRAIHRLAENGCIRRLTARVQDAEGNLVSMRTGPPRTARAIQLLREPNNEDRIAWTRHGNVKDKIDSDSDADGDAEAFGENGAGGDGNAAESGTQRDPDSIAAVHLTKRMRIRQKAQEKAKAKSRAKKAAGRKMSKRGPYKKRDKDLDEDIVDDDEELIFDDDADDDVEDGADDDIEDDEGQPSEMNTMPSTRKRRSSGKRVSYLVPTAEELDSGSESEKAGEPDADQALMTTPSGKRQRKKTAKAAEYETLLADRGHRRTRRMSTPDDDLAVDTNSPQPVDEDDAAPHANSESNSANPAMLPNAYPYISILDDALEFTPLDSDGNIGPSLGSDWRLPGDANSKRRGPRGPYRKKDAASRGNVPKVKKRTEIPEEEYEEFDKFAQLTAERKIRSELSSSRKRDATQAQLSTSPQRSVKTARLTPTEAPSMPTEDLPADRVAFLKSAILTRSEPGIYINPPGARNLKLENFVSRGRPRNTLIAVIKTERLREMEWFEDVGGPRFAPKSSRRRTARIGAGLDVKKGQELVVPPVQGRDAGLVQEPATPAVQRPVTLQVQEPVAPRVQELDAGQVQQSATPAAQKPVAPPPQEATAPATQQVVSISVPQPVEPPSQASNEVTDAPIQESAASPVRTSNEAPSGPPKKKQKRNPIPNAAAAFTGVGAFQASVPASSGSERATQATFPGPTTTQTKFVEPGTYSRFRLGQGSVQPTESSSTFSNPVENEASPMFGVLLNDRPRPPIAPGTPAAPNAFPTQRSSAQAALNALAGTKSGTLMSTEKPNANPPATYPTHGGPSAPSLVYPTAVNPTPATQITATATAYTAHPPFPIESNQPTLNPPPAFTHPPLLPIDDDDILFKIFPSPATRLTALNNEIAALQKERGRKPEKDRVRMEALIREQFRSRQDALNGFESWVGEELKWLEAKEGEEELSREEKGRVELLRQHFAALAEKEGAGMGADPPVTPAKSTTAGAVSSGGNTLSTKQSLIVKFPSPRGKLTAATNSANAEPAPSDGPTMDILTPAQASVTATPVVEGSAANATVTQQSSEPPQKVETFNKEYVLAHPGEDFYHRGFGRYSRGKKPVGGAKTAKVVKTTPNGAQSPVPAPQVDLSLTTAGTSTSLAQSADTTARPPAAVNETPAVQTSTVPTSTATIATPLHGQAGYAPPPTYDKAYVDARPFEEFYHRGGGRYCKGPKPKQLKHRPKWDVAISTKAASGPSVLSAEAQSHPAMAATGKNVDQPTASAPIVGTLAKPGTSAVEPEKDTAAGAADQSASTVNTSLSAANGASFVTDEVNDSQSPAGLTPIPPLPKVAVEPPRTTMAGGVPTYTYDYVLAHPDEIFHNRGNGNYARGPHPANIAYVAYAGRNNPSASTPHIPGVAEKPPSTSKSGEALFSAAYVNSHPDETFHHRGGGRWARGMPPASSALRTTVRGPGGRKDALTGARPAKRSTATPRAPVFGTPRPAVVVATPVQVSPLLNIFRPYSQSSTPVAQKPDAAVVAGTDGAVKDTDEVAAEDLEMSITDNAEAGNEDAEGDADIDAGIPALDQDTTIDPEWAPTADIEEDDPMIEDEWTPSGSTPRKYPRKPPRPAGVNPIQDFPLDESVIVKSNLVSVVVPTANPAPVPQRIFKKKPLKARDHGSSSDGSESDGDVSAEQAKMQGSMQLASYRHDLHAAMQPKTDKSRISRRLRFDVPRHKKSFSEYISSLVDHYERQHAALLMCPAQVFYENSGTFATVAIVAPSQPAKPMEDQFQDVAEKPSAARTGGRKLRPLLPAEQGMLVKLNVPNLESLDLDSSDSSSNEQTELQERSVTTLGANQVAGTKISKITGKAKRAYNRKPKQVSFQQPLDDAGEDPSFVEDDAALEESEEMDDSDAASDGPGPDAASKLARKRRQQPKLASGDIRKRDRQSGALFKDGDRLVVAYALVASLCGGINQDRLNWNLVAHALSFRYDGEFLRRRWVHVRRNRTEEVQKIRDAIHEPFLEAYESNKLPRVDFANLANTDWPALFDWVFEHITPLVPATGTTGPRQRVEQPKQPDLLATRAAVIENFQIEEPAAPYSLRLDEYFAATTDVARKYLATNFHYGVPLTRQLKPGDEAIDNLLLLKSWVRAVAVTKARYYNAEAAAKKLRMFNPNLLQKVTTWMIENHIFAQEKKGRHLPGRNFQVHNDVLAQFRRWPARPDESRFLRFVAQAWSTISAHFEYNNTLDLIPAATDPEYLVLTNMVAQGLIRVKTMLPAITDDFDAPFPRLSPWGYCGDSYETKKVDMSRLRFPIVYEKTPNFSPHHGLRANVPIPLYPPLPFPGEQTLGPRIPFWVDIHGNLIHDVWDMVLRSLLHLLVFRPGVTPRGMAVFHGEKLWEWEILLALGWLERTGVAVRDRRGGWAAGPLWFCAFSRDVAVWEGPEV
ncbi:unnamed protein product [Zymoseptoria tritici ST99CH_3D7]|uniref:Uncharacterized protein n=1 Tax=Zymoseptoria tritici (strain ST99CH_3D7) TaxID=1276538 RepID=A0A1X7RLQ7_ZYMT9|nr:unnamed protein product [Zymoseptoria tritici ST99CH_3D7]